MNTLGLCWGYDDRWLFGFKFKTSFFLIMIVLNILTIAGLQIDRHQLKCE